MQLQEGDVNTYAAARDILCDMARLGNLASRSHISVLEDIEAMENKLSSATAAGGIPFQDALVEITEWQNIMAWDLAAYDNFDLLESPSI